MARVKTGRCWGQAWDQLLERELEEGWEGLG